MTIAFIRCFDGSWQFPGSAFDAPSQGGVKITAGPCPSNIVKLAFLLGNSKDTKMYLSNQLIYYHSGVATEVDDKEKKLKELEGHFGNIHSHLLDAYAWLAKTYKEGDEIYAFGFSRGATIVRSLFSFIRFAGLARGSKFNDHNSLMARVNEAFDIYKSRASDPEGKSAKVAEYRAAHCHDEVNLKFIGVFETVEALNVPEGYSSLVPSKLLSELGEVIGSIEPNSYHDMTIGTAVKYAFQALSIDENRSFFPPTLFEVVDEGKLPEGFIREQKWFRGSHADIGGGWWQKGLSDVALDWMIENAQKAGLAVRSLTDFDDAFSPFILGIDPEFQKTLNDRVIHDYFSSRPNGSGPLGKKVERNIREFMDPKKYFRSSLHSSVTSEFKEWPIPANLKEVI
ncbi:hypothetical protein HDU84_003804 [Entophlyctis sp. JEL0112]|nr:hypothetical protein HDU84_003804 [Entophlyctis sp. JEL0112]